MSELYSIHPIHSVHGIMLILGALGVKERIRKRSHTFSLNRYLREQGAQYVIVEENYVDSGYLLDYTNYYARCHRDYSRITKRLHYFSCKIDEQSFKEFVLGSDANLLDQYQKHYLGFSVLKPLPETIFGRTCLRVYPENKEGSESIRYFPILRRYNVSLFGGDLYIDSVAFQEQDGEVAACSAASIWYALHGNPQKITVEEIPSLYQITEEASKSYASRSATETARKFPTSGLSLSQIEAYFKGRGWECLVAGAKENRIKKELHYAMRSNLAGYIAAYVSAGNPMIVIGALVSSNVKPINLREPELHAITILGFRKDKALSSGDHSGSISRVFSHDDNIGPFCSYQLCDVAVEEGNDKVKQSFVLTTKQMLPTNVETDRYFEPHYFVVPLDPKIRYPYEYVDSLANFFKFAYELNQPGGVNKDSLPPLGWDLKLTNVKKFKSEIVKCKTISRDDISEYIFAPLPKHIWQIRFFWQDKTTKQWHPVLDLLLDATDISQGPALLSMMTHEVPDIFNSVHNVFESKVLYALKGRTDEYRNIMPVLEAIESLINEI